MSEISARTSVRPAGYVQLLCLATILLAAALRLPAHSLTFLNSELEETIISSEGGRFVFFGVIAGSLLIVFQLLALRCPKPATGRYAIAVVVSGATLCIGLVIGWLGVRIGFFPKIPEDMRPSPGIGALVVAFAGFGYAYLSGLRLWRLILTPRAETVTAPDPAA